MASFRSWKFERFIKHLRNGNFEGVKEIIEPDFLEEIVDDENIHLEYGKGCLEKDKLLIKEQCDMESETKAGKRPIHYGCESGNLEIVKLLIENKCNIESETKNGKRPIHYGCESGNFEIVKLLIEKQCDVGSETKEKMRSIHYACKSGNLEIVKLLIEKKSNIESEDNEGRRPIHYACEKGHFEIVKLLIEKKCNIESENKRRLKPIHLACKNNHFETVKLLTDNKCNFEIEAEEKTRLIHLACKNGNFQMVNLLIENKCNIEIENKEGKRPIHLACEKGHFEIVKLLIENNCNIESEYKKGKRPIHLAIEYGNLEIVKLLIEKKCNMENETDMGLRPIHLACVSGHKEIVKLLIIENCLINVSDKRGKTPLDWAKAKGHEEIVRLILEFDNMTKQINDSISKDDYECFAEYYNSDLLTGRNWLEMAWNQKADKIIKYFLDRPIDITEIHYIKNVIKNHPSKSINAELWEEVLLYKTIKDNHEKGFQKICKPHIMNRPKKIIPCSFLELAAENENIILVQEIMKKTFYDSETWKRAKEIALLKGYHHINNSISNREVLLNCRQKDNVSILHTAVCDNDPEMLEYILCEGLVDPNHNHEVLGTPLAFSILLSHRECLPIFERFDVDCNTQNKYLQSPLHEAINNGMIEHYQYLMDHVENIDQPGFMGQTALHSAVIRGCEELCDQLIKRGADCLRYMEFCQPFTEIKDTPISKDPLQLSQRENPLTLCLKRNKTIYPCFLKSLDKDKANISDDEGNSLLHISANLMKPGLSNILLQAGADIDLLNKKGNTPLIELLSDADQQFFISNEDKLIETVNLFVQSGCDLKKSLKGDLSLVQIITKFNSERLLLALLPRQQNQLFEIDENILKIALERHFYRFCETLLKVYPKEDLTPSVTFHVIEEAVKDNCPTLLKSLVMNAADDVQQIVLEFSLYHLATLDDKDSFECLLNIEINNPLCFENGETLLTRLLKESKFDFCRQIIESNNKIYINFKNKRNQTPLQVAIETESLDVMLSLLYETENIDNEDSEGHTALMQLFEKISNKNKKNEYLQILNAIQVLISEGGNIYHETPKGRKAIDYCSSTTTKAEIERFYDGYIKSAKPITQKVIEERIVTIEKKTCPICLDKEVDSVFECGHTICQICSDDIKKCPFCGVEPVRPKRIYFN